LYLFLLKFVMEEGGDDGNEPSIGESSTEGKQFLLQRVLLRIKLAL